MNNQLAVMSIGALTIEQLLEQRSRIEAAMKQAMKENMHFGKIKGCGEKPTLLQPGAQLLCTLFRLRPEYEIFPTEMEGGHKSYRVTCRLYYMGSDPAIQVGEGLGEASSMESKHRYRNAAAEVEDTGDELPKAYWEIRNTKGDQGAKEWLASGYDGQNVGAKKIDGVWKVVIFKGGNEGKVENENPADVHNTVLKMAKKRAFVDATITATASNDLFTQDLEDIRANMDAVDSGEPVKPKAAAEKHAGGHPEKKAAHSNKSPELKGWGDVVCHFGKPGGPIKGVKLSAMIESKRQWLYEHMMEKPEAKLSTDDRKLLAALALWNAEKQTGRTQTGVNHPATGADEQRTANLATLSEHLDNAGIDNETFFKVSAANNWTAAEAFDEFTAQDAEQFLANIETVIAKCREAKGDTLL